MRRRTALLASFAAVALAASTAHGKTAPQIVDAKGDALGMQAGTDIESVTFELTRLGRVVNGFTVTMTLGAPPVRQPGVLYRVYGEHDTCGGFQMSSAATLALVEQNQVLFSCGSPPDETGSTSTIINVTPKTVGNSLVWAFKTKMLPKEMRTGTLSSLEAFVTMSDPVTGILNPAVFVPQTAFDHAVGDRTFDY